ncbi:hypothetical protein NDU88_007617 [Pleurodeles waltl]|uniref:Uncharacterized protein n=1 Tax=Pleurodeles waltl TaxID=8319 RepID=A0AAV7N2P8_PLEWA|nr:hypothetical protein NDU88_007617 [Pleurodeles waltl]
MEVTKVVGAPVRSARMLHPGPVLPRDASSKRSCRRQPSPSSRSAGISSSLLRPAPRSAQSLAKAAADWGAAHAQLADFAIMSLPVKHGCCPAEICSAHWTAHRYSEPYIVLHTKVIVIDIILKLVTVCRQALPC